MKRLDARVLEAIHAFGGEAHAEIIFNRIPKRRWFGPDLDDVREALNRLESAGHVRAAAGYSHLHYFAL